MRLVNQQRGRASGLEDAPQRYQRVKGVVVIAADHIGRFTQQERKLKRAQAVLLAQCIDARRIPALFLGNVHQRRQLTVIVSLGARAEIRMAAHFGLRTALFLGCQHHPACDQSLRAHAL